MSRYQDAEHHQPSHSERSDNEPTYRQRNTRYGPGASGCGDEPVEFCRCAGADDVGQCAGFVIPNPWDAGTARILTALGFEALATTSAGFAFSIGRRDSAAGLTRDEVLENARAIVDATHLPVSADLEDGVGRAPGTCAETIKLAAAGGGVAERRMAVRPVAVRGFSLYPEPAPISGEGRVTTTVVRPRRP